MKLLIFIIPALLSFKSYAGIETVLLKKTYGSCTIRIIHDATPSSKTGTIRFRSYNVLNRVHEPCPPKKEDISASLNSAFKIYLHKNLKPATSIKIGRLIRYPWIRDYLARQAPLPANTLRKNRARIFNSRLFLQEVLAPFQKAVSIYNYKISKTACEKILVNRQGLTTDALCWLILQEVKE